MIDQEVYEVWLGILLSGTSFFMLLKTLLLHYRISN